MNRQLILYRNELKNSKIQTYKLIGIVSELVLSKEIFKNNIDIEDFIVNVFNLRFKDYLYKSRTLLVARLTREILNNDSHAKQTKVLYKFIVSKIDEDNINTNNQLDGWL